jgi:hypothetical protein
VRGTRELVITGTPYVAPYRIKRGSVEMTQFFMAVKDGQEYFKQHEVKPTRKVAD